MSRPQSTSNPSDPILFLTGHGGPGHRPPTSPSRLAHPHFSRNRGNNAPAQEPVQKMNGRPQRGRRPMMNGGGTPFARIQPIDPVWRNGPSRNEGPRCINLIQGTNCEGVFQFRTKFCEASQLESCADKNRCDKSHCLTWQRRNPTEHLYAPTLCEDINFIRKSGDRKMQLSRKCGNGKSCEFSHSKEEKLYHPLCYKTQSCSNEVCLSDSLGRQYFCPFAHSQDELRTAVNEEVRRHTGYLLGLSRPREHPGEIPRRLRPSEQTIRIVGRAVAQDLLLKTYIERLLRLSIFKGSADVLGKLQEFMFYSSPYPNAGFHYSDSDMVSPQSSIRTSTPTFVPYPAMLNHMAHTFSGFPESASELAMLSHHRNLEGSEPLQHAIPFNLGVVTPMPANILTSPPLGHPVAVNVSPMSHHNHPNGMISSTPVILPEGYLVGTISPMHTQQSNAHVFGFIDPPFHHTNGPPAGPPLDGPSPSIPGTLNTTQCQNSSATESARPTVAGFELSDSSQSNTGPRKAAIDNQSLNYDSLTERNSTSSPPQHPTDKNNSNANKSPTAADTAIQRPLPRAEPKTRSFQGPSMVNIDPNAQPQNPLPESPGYRTPNPVHNEESEGQYRQRRGMALPPGVVVGVSPNFYVDRYFDDDHFHENHANEWANGDNMFPASPIGYPVGPRRSFTNFEGFTTPTPAHFKPSRVEQSEARREGALPENLRRKAYRDSFEYAYSPKIPPQEDEEWRNGLVSPGYEMDDSGRTFNPMMNHNPQFQRAPPISYAMNPYRASGGMPDTWNPAEIFGLQSPQGLGSPAIQSYTMIDHHQASDRSTIHAVFRTNPMVSMSPHPEYIQTPHSIALAQSAAQAHHQTQQQQQHQQQQHQQQQQQQQQHQQQRQQQQQLHQQQQHQQQQQQQLQQQRQEQHRPRVSSLSATDAPVMEKLIDIHSSTNPQSVECESPSHISSKDSTILNSQAFSTNSESHSTSPNTNAQMQSRMGGPARGLTTVKISAFGQAPNSMMSKEQSLNNEVMGTKTNADATNQVVEDQSVIELASTSESGISNSRNVDQDDATEVISECLTEAKAVDQANNSPGTEPLQMSSEAKAFVSVDEFPPSTRSEVPSLTTAVKSIPIANNVPLPEPPMQVLSVNSGEGKVREMDMKIKESLSNNPEA